MKSHELPACIPLKSRVWITLAALSSLGAIGPIAAAGEGTGKGCTAWHRWLQACQPRQLLFRRLSPQAAAMRLRSELLFVRRLLPQAQHIAAVSREVLLPKRLSVQAAAVTLQSACEHLVQVRAIPSLRMAADDSVRRFAGMNLLVELAAFISARRFFAPPRPPLRAILATESLSPAENLEFFDSSSRRSRAACHRRLQISER